MNSGECMENNFEVKTSNLNQLAKLSVLIGILQNIPFTAEQFVLLKRNPRVINKLMRTL